MKALNWIALISTGIGLFLILLAAISLIFGIHIMGRQISSYFHAANSFFLLTIVIFLFIQSGQQKKE
jgi:hypothetical protein